MAVFEIGSDGIGPEIAFLRGRRREVPSMEVSTDAPHGVRITQGPFGSYETVEMSHKQAYAFVDIITKKVSIPWWARSIA